MKSVFGSKREKTLAVITAVVLFCAAVFFGIVLPEIQHYHLQKQRLSKMREKLAKMNGDLMVKDQIQNFYARIEHLLVSEETEQREISALTQELTDLYSSLNVKVRSIKILPVTKQEFYTKLAVRIEMTGHIRDILKMIFSLERYREPISIEKLELFAQDTTDRVKAVFTVTKVTAELST